MVYVRRLIVKALALLVILHAGNFAQIGLELRLESIIECFPEMEQIPVFETRIVDLYQNFIKPGVSSSLPSTMIAIAAGDLRFLKIRAMTVRNCLNG